MSQGRLIVFEGTDGVGKTELAKRTAALLSTSASPFVYLPFPGRAEGSLGKLVYNLHHNAMELGVSHITPTALQALHVAAHLDGLEALIIPALRAGKNIVLDRFWWSTLVYGRVYGVQEDTLATLLRLEQCGWNSILPDLVLLISRAHPLRAEPPDVWRRTKDAYQLLSEQERGKYPVSIIDNDGDIERGVEAILLRLAQQNLGLY